MDATIVIPSYNTQDTIANTLSHIVPQLHSEFEIEVVVVDCSDHDKVKVAVSQFPSIRFHHVSERFNPGIGRNIGAEIAAGKLLIFIDADIELDHNAVHNAISHHKNGAKIFGGSLELNPKTAIGVASYLEHYYFNHESHANRPAASKKNLSSAFLCVDRNLFIEEGGFKDIPRMQDTELTERLAQKGITLMFYPDLLALQTQDSPLKKVLGKILINGQNLYYIRYQKKLSKISFYLLFLILPILAIIKISRILLRHLRYHPLNKKVLTVALTPLLVLGIFYWMIGFYQAMIFQRGINPNRD